jgi:cytochrome c oxidase cbb3-type subunit III
MDHDQNKREIDQVTGVETTGHDWDGIKELNNPAPRWWLWVFYLTVIWSFGYFILFPAWPIPGGATAGYLGYSQYKALEESQTEIAIKQQAYLDRFHASSFQDIMKDPELYAFAQAGGATLFKDNCATCHGAGGAGRASYPNLADDDWLWGGKVNDIYDTIRYGIRSGDDNARVGPMPAFGKDGLLKREDIDVVVDYVRALSSDKKPASFAQGAEIFKTSCASCHGDDARGNYAFGAPNLTDHIWLYGSDRKTVYQSVFNGRGGVMPVWRHRLSKDQMRELAIYVHELGGGEEGDAPASTEETGTPSNESE